MCKIIRIAINPSQNDSKCDQNTCFKGSGFSGVIVAFWNELDEVICLLNVHETCLD